MMQVISGLAGDITILVTGEAAASLMAMMQHKPPPFEVTFLAPTKFLDPATGMVVPAFNEEQAAEVGKLERRGQHYQRLAEDQAKLAADFKRQLEEERERVFQLRTQLHQQERIAQQVPPGAPAGSKPAPKGMKGKRVKILEMPKIVKGTVVGSNGTGKK